MLSRRLLAPTLACALSLTSAAGVHAAPSGTNGAIFYSLTSGGKHPVDSIGAVAPDGSGDHPVVGSSKQGAVAPSVSSDGKRLAYTVETGTKLRRKVALRTSAVDGSAPIALPHTNNVDGAPAWSIDGSRLLYTTKHGGMVSIPSAGGGAASVLFNDPSSKDVKADAALQAYVSPHIRPDGSLAYLRLDVSLGPSIEDFFNVTSAVWSAATAPPYATAGTLTRLFTAPGLGPLIEDFDVSPDGARYAFITAKSIAGDPRVLLVGSAAGTDAHQLATTDPAYPQFGSPAWSPDGTKVVVAQRSAAGKHGSELDIIDVATGAKTVVKKVAKGTFDNPFWAPTPTP